ncbi:glycoside hydrolase family 65 protein [Anaerocolumna xylanovorans]|uniref:Alpha,alpha-trehalose phosphorylase n=1 Tax=Anaerocolumna xylanovorans DSM 12503 TaxID=1121345 RepID=A0A1M7Y9L2_9FIRM|nr:glycosyl hydrolase family 65 protein [Anaerocolumna xylanovorans]SHO49324.1 alpha,alpha-trehalose phosphorylase [Anaerocolumna xylanovorans DSM 12503]
MGLQYKVYEIDDNSKENNDLMVNETVFHNANGYIGIRSNYEEGYPGGYDTIRGSYINGFYDIADMKQAEKLCGLVEDKQAMLNVADTQTVFLDIDGEIFSLFEGEVLRSKRFLDMEAGVTGRAILWRSPAGKEAEIVIKRMASFCQLTLFAMEYSVKAVNFNGSIGFSSYHMGEVTNYSNANDPRVAQESKRYLLPMTACLEEGISYLTSMTSKSGLTVCTGVAHILAKEGMKGSEVSGADENVLLKKGEHSACYKGKIPVKEQETVTLTKYTVFCDSIRHEDCGKAARQEMEKALSIPLSAHYEAQREYLKEFWNNCFLEIKGDDALTEAVNYNMYQLIQSVGKDEFCNIAAKGLSGEGYEGHYFWDTEMYIQPFFNLTEPSITKNLINFRYSTLEKARENAYILGHKKGVLYPWRTIMGVECSGYFPSGTAAYHINGDIAYSIISYYLATKDMEFVADKGAEIIFETARLWLDVGNYYQGSFRINEVTGPDEYTCMVNNNYFTNAAAQYNLNWAVKFYGLLKEAGKLQRVADKIGLTDSEVEEFKRAAESMYLPYDETLGINPQDDSFLQKKVWDIPGTPAEEFPLLLHYHPLHLYRYQVCKQADTVLAHFIFEDAQSLETIRKSFEYYEKVTTHDSSLSTCIFSIVASKLGLVEKAYEYFGDSAKLDLFNTHKNTRDGIHTANMGGTFMAIVYGFAGLRIKESGICFAPVLPKCWEEYCFRINYEDSRIKVEVGAEESIFTLISGTAKQIHVYQDIYELSGRIAVKHKS